MTNNWQTRLEGRDGGHLNPLHWREHRFGLSAERWQALSNRPFWITGAGTGYGRAVTVALTAAGARVFISGRRADMLEETRASCRELGIDAMNCFIAPADVTDGESLAKATEAMVRHTSFLCGLVHCAAKPQPPSGPTPLAELSTENWRRLVDTNITGPWLVWKAAWPLLCASERWRVLLFSSAAGWSDTPGFGPYNLTKAALNNLGMSLAAEASRAYPSRDIQINVLEPGEARTEMNKGSLRSPYAVVTMTLALLSHPAGGPNGHFFHRDGRHLSFANSPPFPADLLNPD
jgi:NAD(P)-dependent dehydrogenase (short-subunit alcohol dehydrogenase family)